MYQAAFLRERIQMRDHMFRILLRLTVAAAWPLSFATVTRQGAFMTPIGLPTPSPSKIPSSVMNMISSENAWEAIDSRATWSCCSSSETYIPVMSFFKSNSSKRNCGFVCTEPCHGQPLGRCPVLLCGRGRRCESNETEVPLARIGLEETH